MQQSRRWRMLNALIAGVFCLALLLPLFQAQAAGKNSLTIVRYKQGAALHEINKKPEGGEPVAGSVFTLWKVGEERSLSTEEYTQFLSALENKTVEELTAAYQKPVTSGKTDSKGEIKIPDLEDGLYYVRENDTGKGTIAPLLVPLPLQTENGPETNVTVYPKIVQPETPSGEIVLTKTDLRGKPLEGAHFRLFQKTAEGLIEVPLMATSNAPYRYDRGGQTDVDLVSGSDGTLRVINLPEGEYVFKEVQAPIGYTADAVQKSATVKAEKTTQLTVTNAPNETGGFRFQKISKDGKKTPLAGAKFAVFVKTEQGWQSFRRDGKDVVLTSGADGFFALTDVPFGRYALYEIATPKGYQFNDEHIFFTVDATSYDEGKFIPIENEKTPPGTPPGTPPTRPPKKPPVKTGDRSMLSYILLAGAAGCGLLLLGRKKKEE